MDFSDFQPARDARQLGARPRWIAGAPLPPQRFRAARKQGHVLAPKPLKTIDRGQKCGIVRKAFVSPSAAPALVARRPLP